MFISFNWKHSLTIALGCKLDNLLMELLSSPIAGCTLILLLDTYSTAETTRLHTYSTAARTALSDFSAYCACFFVSWAFFTSKQTFTSIFFTFTEPLLFCTLGFSLSSNNFHLQTSFHQCTVYTYIDIGSLEALLMDDRITSGTTDWWAGIKQCWFHKNDIWLS